MSLLRTTEVTGRGVRPRVRERAEAGTLIGIGPHGHLLLAVLGGLAEFIRSGRFAAYA
jgi:hypothetical protein